ncbi:TnsA-like heteromeric transposase endonuclease subunit [Saccharothrix xinjiangensis]|uniref:TnsA-like heteromeric transposase endonuclease subunit n=1 Tax=Saccharothrix xinjiangensis TaxID=204798 RepID=A0ABV9XW29_9PSEU
MPELGVLPGGAPPASEGFELVFADEFGEQRVGLTEAWSVPLESCRPVRGFPSFKGQRHHVGRWWTATTETLVGFESWLERDRLILLDFDPAVVGIASQPFWLFFTTAEGKRRSHAPDYFARLVDGSALVLDCRPTARIKPRDRVAFEVTARACAVLGWRYEVVDAAAPVLMGNVRWLAAYRHPRHDLAAVAGALREVFAEPAGLLEGAGAVGDPIAVLPVLFHLLWRRELRVELSTPLHTGAVVSW